MISYIRKYKLVKYYGVEHNKDLLSQKLYDDIDNYYTIFSGCTKEISITRIDFYNYSKDGFVIFGYRNENYYDICLSDHLDVSLYDPLIPVILKDLYDLDRRIYSGYLTFKENLEITNI